LGKQAGSSESGGKRKNNSISHEINIGESNPRAPERATLVERNSGQNKGHRQTRPAAISRVRFDFDPLRRFRDESVERSGFGAARPANADPTRAAILPQ
jgi:hypothetical protein